MSEFAAKSLFDIRNYGASCADGVINTRAIQSAVNACHQAGGGVVYCPPGLLLTGTVWLKSHVTLYVEAGCTLLGSPRRDDYEESLPFPESEVCAEEKTSAAHLLIAYRAENVTISGRGVIDGNGPAFLPHLTSTAAYPSGYWDWRPGQMVYFCLCQDVHVEGVALNNSPYWTLFFHGCTGVQVHGVSIANGWNTPNGDGIDVDCCRKVCLDSCRISSGDDCITLRARSTPLGAEAQPCENVTVTNCTLRTRCNAVRVGVGEGVFRNCVFSNLIIHESHIGLNVVANWAASSSGAQVEHVRFANLVIDAAMPFYLALGCGGETASVKDLALTEIDARGTAAAFIGGTRDVPLSTVTLRNVDLVVSGGTRNSARETAFDSGLSEGEIFGLGLPYALCLAEAQDILLEGVRVRWGETTGPWQHAVFARNVEGLVFSRVEATTAPSATTGAAALHCVHCAGLALHACRAAPRATRFLWVEESPAGATVHLLGNDFTQAEEAVVCDSPLLESGNLLPAADSVNR
jgi:polygalacturonase